MSSYIQARADGESDDRAIRASVVLAAGKRWFVHVATRIMGKVTVLTGSGNSAESAVERALWKSDVNGLDGAQTVSALRRALAQFPQARLPSDWARFAQ